MGLFLNSFNPYLFPFGPEGQAAPSSPTTSQSDDPFDFGTPTGYAQNVPPPRKSLSNDEVPVAAQVVEPSQPKYGPPKKVAVAAKSAIASLILGIISLVGFFLGLSIFAALGAIITGHVGLSKIKRSAGALTGTGMARMGLITGYFGFVLSLLVIGLFVHLIVNRPHRPRVARANLEDQLAQWEGETAKIDPKVTASADVLEKVENLLDNANQGSAHGNSTEAVALAEQFNSLMRKLPSRMPTPSSLSDAFKNTSYTTHCQVHSDRVSLMIRVHEFDDTSELAKTSLKQLAWATACFSLGKSLPRSNHLVVTLRDSSGNLSSQYGSLGSFQQQSEIVNDSLAKFYASSDDELPEISTFELLYPPNRSLVGIPRDRSLFGRVPDRSGLPGVTPPPADPTAPRRSLTLPPPESNRGNSSLSQRLQAAPPSGIRQIARAIPAYQGTPLELNPEEHAKAIIDSRFAPSSNGSPIWETITAVTFSPDGKQLAVGIESGNVYLYQLNGKDLHTLSGTDAKFAVTALAFSPDGKKLYVGSKDSSIAYYMLSYPTTNLKRIELNRGLTPSHMVLSADGHTIYAAGGTSLFQGRAFGIGGLQRTREAFMENIDSLVLDQEGLGVLFSDGRKLVRLDRTKQNEELADFGFLAATPCDISPAAQLTARAIQSKISLRSFDRHARDKDFFLPMRATSLRFTPQGDRLVIGGLNSLSIIEPGTTRKLVNYIVDTGEELVVRDISRDGKFAVVQVQPRGSILYVVPLPEITTSATSPASPKPSTPVTVAKTTPRPSTIPPTPQPTVVAKVEPKTSADNLPEESSSTSPSATNPFESSTTTPPPLNTLLPSADSAPADPSITQLPIAKHRVAAFNYLPHGADALAFSPSGQNLIAAKSDNTLLYFNLEKKTKHTIEVEQLGEFTAMVYGLDGKTVYAANDSGKIFAWEIDESPQLLNKRELAGHEGKVSSLILGISGKFIVSAGQDNRIVWQQLSPNGKVRSATISGSPITHLRELPGRSTVIATDGKQFTRINLLTAEAQPDKPLSDIGKAAGQVSSDGKLAASVDGRLVIVWDLAEGKVLHTLHTNESTRSLHFTRDGKYLLAAGREKIVVFNPREGKTLAHFVFPDPYTIHQLVVSPDGQRLACYVDSLGKQLYVLSLAELDSLK